MSKFYKEDMTIQGVVLTPQVRRFFNALAGWFKNREDRGEDCASATWSTEDSSREEAFMELGLVVVSDITPDGATRISGPFYKFTDFGKKIYANWLLHPEADAEVGDV
jgi:hypothetical protein